MLIDAFTFYNELDLLELRFTVLDQYVDRFVLVESELTHAGGPKKLFFEENKQRYKMGT
jgi:beta-1,4-mannosyl-glycoprotein beta-1,4-N-acetylglucosaminyltransferase